MSDEEKIANNGYPVDLKDGKPMMISINADEPTRRANAKKMAAELNKVSKEEVNKVANDPIVQALMAREYLNGYSDGSNAVVGKHFEDVFREVGHG